jgi:Protein of unknown function (DUF3631)
LLSAAIVAELISDPEGDWGEYWRGKPLTQKKLAELLRNFGVHSQEVRPPDGPRGMGYRRVWLEDAWSRYLSADTHAPPPG